MILGYPHFLDTSIEPDLTINQLPARLPDPRSAGSWDLEALAPSRREHRRGPGRAYLKWMDDEWDDEWFIFHEPNASLI